MRQLREEDRDQILTYVGLEPEMNLFFIGDIENFGVDTEEVSIFVQDEEEGRSELYDSKATVVGEVKEASCSLWDSILLKFYDNYIIYSRKENYNARAVAEFLKEQQVDCISGKTSLVRQLTPYYPQYHLQETFLCRCDGDTEKKGEAVKEEYGHLLCEAQERSIPEALAGMRAETATVRRLSEKNSPEMMQVLLKIEEFAPTYREPDKSEQQMKEELIRGELAVGVFEDDRLVSLAKTSASNSMSAMVVGVATDPDYRRRGYASLAMKELCKTAFAEGKKFLCLFYDNPEAGRIYHRIGFEKVGSYAMLR